MVIFPEFGLGGIYDNRDSIYPFCIPSPKVGILPCNGSGMLPANVLYVTFYSGGVRGYTLLHLMLGTIQ